PRIYQLLTPRRWQMFGEISGFFGVRHICNAREACMSSPALCCEWPKFAQFGGQSSIARYRWFPNSVGLPPSAAVLNEALTRLESETRTPMQSDRDCVFSALGGGG